MAIHGAMLFAEVGAAGEHTPALEVFQIQLCVSQLKKYFLSELGVEQEDVILKNQSC